VCGEILLGRGMVNEGGDGEGIWLMGFIDMNEIER
jgi:hypothetical protein